MIATLGLFVVLAAPPVLLAEGDTCKVSKPLRVTGAKGKLPKGATVTVVRIEKSNAIVKSGKVSGKVKLSTLGKQCKRTAVADALVAPGAALTAADLPPLLPDLPPEPADNKLPDLPPAPDEPALVAAAPKPPPILAAAPEPAPAPVVAPKPSVPPLPEAPPLTPVERILAASTATPPPPIEVATTSKSSGGGGAKTLGLVLGGAGVLALGGSAAAFVIGGQRAKALSDDVAAFNQEVATGGGTTEQANALDKRRKDLGKLDTIVVGAGVAGVAAVITGIVLFATGGEPEPSSSVSLSALPMNTDGLAVELSGHF